uniref:Uncharacterized protein n=1 Tax=Udotea sp. TZ0819 TaxID=2364085 RepID=A0A386B224_9CHLO|nr:hypothetical protein [Udotea sp. TZ0819]
MLKEKYLFYCSMFFCMLGYQLFSPAQVLASSRNDLLPSLKTPTIVERDERINLKRPLEYSAHEQVLTNKCKSVIMVYQDEYVNLGEKMIEIIHDNPTKQMKTFQYSAKTKSIIALLSSINSTPEDEELILITMVPKAAYKKEVQKWKNLKKILKWSLPIGTTVGVYTGYKIFKFYTTCNSFFDKIDNIVENNLNYNPDHIPIIKRSFLQFLLAYPKASPILTDIFFENLNRFYFCPKQWIMFIDIKEKIQPVASRNTPEYHSPQAKAYLNSIDSNNIISTLREEFETNRKVFLENEEEILPPNTSFSAYPSQNTVLFNFFLRNIMFKFWSSSTLSLDNQLISAVRTLVDIDT